MLMPKRVKRRKQFRGRMKGKALRGNTITYGDYGLVAMEPSWITANQIEAARIVMTRTMKRGGKVWVKIFPDKPVTEKPAETRMGSGKGSLEYWVAVVKPGRIMFEIAGTEEEIARQALKLASHKLPIKCKIISREEEKAEAAAALLKAEEAAKAKKVEEVKIGQEEDAVKKPTVKITKATNETVTVPETPQVKTKTQKTTIQEAVVPEESKPETSAAEAEKETVAISNTTEEAPIKKAPAKKTVAKKPATAKKDEIANEEIKEETKAKAPKASAAKAKAVKDDTAEGESKPAAAKTTRKKKTETPAPADTPAE